MAKKTQTEKTVEAGRTYVVEAIRLLAEERGQDLETGADQSTSEVYGFAALLLHDIILELREFVLSEEKEEAEDVDDKA